LITEAPKKAAACIRRFALEQGKDVLAVPGKKQQGSPAPTPDQDGASGDSY